MAKGSRKISIRKVIKGEEKETLKIRLCENILPFIETKMFANLAPQLLFPFRIN